MTPTPAEQHERAILAATIARLPLATLRLLARVASALEAIDAGALATTAADVERKPAGGGAFVPRGDATGRLEALSAVARMRRALERWRG